MEKTPSRCYLKQLHINAVAQFDAVAHSKASKQSWFELSDLVRLGTLILVVLLAQMLLSLTSFAHTYTGLVPPVPSISSTANRNIAFSPVKGRLTSVFGWRSDPYSGKKRFHSGVDIGAPSGTTVYVPQDGVVTWSGRYKGYGNLVSVFHPPNLYTLYGHNSKLLVKRGQQVKAGTPIALVGSTGRSTGPHLHFEVRQNNGYINPLQYLQYLKASQSNPVLANKLYHNMGGSVASAPVPAAGNHSTGGPEINLKRSLGKSLKRGKAIEIIRGSQIETVHFR